MTILFCTQAVDLDNPVLGFVHRWLEEFSKHFDRIEVICLYEGRNELPANVVVHSLGKEQGVSRLTYILRFYRYIFSLKYDDVFVHANEEYVMLGGVFWRLMGKKVVLRRIFRTGSWMTPIAAFLVNVLDSTSREAYTSRYKKAVYSSMGIDTDLFSPGKDLPVPHSVLFLGRIDTVKRVEVFLEAMKLLAEDGVETHADIYGDPTPGHEAYAAELKKKYAGLKNVSFYPGVRNTETPPIYCSHEIYVNITPSGSLDKTIAEAMACGATVVSMNESVRDVLPPALMTGETAQETADAIRAALTLSPEERQAVTQKSREWVESKQSLVLLAQMIAGTFSK